MRFALAIIVVLLGACGGGGGDSLSDSTEPPAALTVDASNAALDAEGASFRLAATQSQSAASLSSPAAAVDPVSGPASARTAFVTLAAAAPAVPQAAVAQVVQLVKVGELRRDRTLYDYVFRVVLHSPNKSLSQVNARVLAVGDGTTIVQGAAIFDEVIAGAKAASKNTITLRHDRTKPFNAQALRWAVATFTPLTRPAIEAVATRAVVDPAVLNGDGVVVADGRDPLLLNDPTGGFGATGAMMFFDGTVRRVLSVGANAQGVRQLRTEELPLTAAFKDLAFATSINPLAAMATLSSGATVQAGPQTLGRKFVQAVKRIWASDSALPPVMNFKVLSAFDCIVPSPVLEAEDGEASMRWEVGCSTKALGIALGQQWPDLGSISGYFQQSSKMTYTLDAANRDDYTTTQSRTEWSGGFKAGASNGQTLVNFESENGNFCRVSRQKTTCELWLLKQPLVTASVYVAVPGIPVPVPVVLEVKPRLSFELSGEGEVTAFHISTRHTVTGVKAGNRLPAPSATDFGSNGETSFKDVSSGTTATSLFETELQLLLVAKADIGRLKHVSDTSLASVEFGAGLYGRAQRQGALNAQRCWSADLGAMAALKVAILDSEVLRGAGLFDGLRIDLAEQRWPWKDWAAPEGCTEPIDWSKPKFDSTSYTIAGVSNYKLDAVNSTARRDIYRASGQWLEKRQAQDRQITINMAQLLADNVRFRHLAIVEPVVSSPRATGLSGALDIQRNDDATLRSAFMKVNLGDAQPGDKIVINAEVFVDEDGKRDATRVTRTIRIDFEEIPQVLATYEFVRTPDGRTRYEVNVDYGDNETWRRLQAASVERANGSFDGITRAFELPNEYLLKRQEWLDAPNSNIDDVEAQRPLWLLVETGSTTGSEAAYRYPITADRQPRVRAVQFANVVGSGKVYPDDEELQPLSLLKLIVFGHNLPADLPVEIPWCTGLVETVTEPAMFEAGVRSTVEREFTCTIARAGQGLQTTVLGFAAQPRTVKELTGLNLVPPDAIFQGQAADFRIDERRFTDYARSLVTVIWHFGESVVKEVQGLTQWVAHTFATAGQKIISLVYQVQGKRIGSDDGFVVTVQPGAGGVAVTAVSPLTAVAGVMTTFEVVGANMPQGLAFNLPGCNEVSEVLVGTGTGLRRFNCTFDPTTPEGEYQGNVASGSSIFGAPPYFEFKVRVSRIVLGAVLPVQTIRTLATSFEFAGQNLPATGLSVVPVGDARSTCQAPNNPTPGGFGVACELYKVGVQTLEVRQGASVLGSVTVNVASNVTGVTWASPSTSSSGTVKFGETVTFTVHGENLTADPVMGFAVEKCGVSNTEVGVPTNSARTFICFFNNEAGAVAGQMPGVVKDAPGGQVLLDGWKVPVEVQAAPTSKLPHTGVTANQCYAAGSNTLVACNSPGALALNGQQDGHRAGVNAMGYSLVDSYSKDECVLDAVTGLVWEGKTASGLRAGSQRYTNIGDGRAGDASAYVGAVNAARLCGFSDWRLPTVVELQGLVNYGIASPGPTIDLNWFPNSSNALHWTAEGSAASGSIAWYVYFDYGSASWSDRGNAYAVRLVRGDATQPQYSYSAGGDEVTDSRTGLVWRRCVEGMRWSGGTCIDSPLSFTHEGALAHARSQPGWRVPNVKELSSLADRSRLSPAVDIGAFPATPVRYYWTATPLIGNPEDAWLVRADTGAVFNATGRSQLSGLGLRLVKSALIAPSGRRYEVLACGTWTNCRSAARARGGELATIRNKAESDWLIANVLPEAKTEYGLWIGLNDEAQPGVWSWTSGEPVTFTNWRVAEPNNLWVDGRAESYVHMWRGNSTPTFLPGVWNDIIDEPIFPLGSGVSIITQAIVEYER